MARRSRLPAYGNRVSHAALFDRPAAPASASPPRLWRASPEIYAQLVKDLTSGRVAITQPFPIDSGTGIKDYSGLFLLDEPTTSQLIRNAQAIVGYQTRYKRENGTIKGVNGSVKEFLELLDPRKEVTPAAVNKAIARQFDLVLKRKPTAEEAKRFAQLMQKNIEDAGREKGVRTTLAAVLLLPEVIYRLELGRNQNAKETMLSPRELAYALSFALTDKRPDNLLLKAAEEGRLQTVEDVRKQVQRLFNDPKTPKTRVFRFFREFFGYHKAPDIFKEKKEFPHHEPRILVQDTDLLVEYILERDKNVFYELLTTNKSFVNYRPDRKGPKPAANPKKQVHLAYGLPENWKWTKDQPIELPRDQRAGILTQPSWLVAHSANVENHPIIRGKWIRERLLGGFVPELPITVDAQLPEDPNKTLRERMMVTHDAYCWRCHQHMNPLGLPFEMFDHFGRFRTLELGKPVVTTGSIDRSGDPTLDGEVNNAIDMIKRLARSKHVEQVFVRHAFRYWMGRNETLEDAAVLQDAYRAYKESGGSMKALVTSLLTSKAFLYRRNPQPAAKD
ncbi:MAG: hypothetical protein KatS3mg105_0943 [Gemmatales bacterium]|nr:MAG: hypothetical protein KatS3mg105_0943 [Gemmatales bacterium]